MIVVLLGAPGAGKGTQGDLLVDGHGFVKISTGDLLRSEIKAQSDIGKKAQAIVEAGRLVSDDILLAMVQKSLATHAGKKVLLDGYPRNLSQAEDLDQLRNEFPINGVIYLDVGRDEIKKRLCSRRVCDKCGFTTSLSDTALTSGIEQKCTKCGGVFVQRKDDTSEKVSLRLDIFEKETFPVLGFYETKGACFRLDGSKAPKEVSEQLLEVLKRI